MNNYLIMPLIKTDNTDQTLLINVDDILHIIETKENGTSFCIITTKSNEKLKVTLPLKRIIEILQGLN